MHRYIFPLVLGAITSITLLAIFLGGDHIVLFSPKGIISVHEVNLMVLALRLMLIVVVPVFILTILIAWRYGAENLRARYLPNWEHNTIEEVIWWAVPALIILSLAVITWSSTHALDPYKPLVSTEPPLTIEVVSLDWKWLFIYPEQGIATVNYLKIPVSTPVNFKLTSDAPMNALWIPQLAGQEMTMPGMITQLHILTDTVGTYRGLSSTYSGQGFAGMHFMVDAVSKDDFSTWVTQTKMATTTLDWDSYRALAKPSTDVPPQRYVLTDAGLYTKIVMQFMKPQSATSSMGTMPMTP